MNIFIFDTCPENGLLELNDRQRKHLTSVLKAKTDDPIRIGLLNGPIGYARVKNDRSLEVVDLNDHSPPPLPLIVVLALPRPKSLKRILRSLANFGVKEIHLTHSYRVEKAFWQSPLLKLDTLHLAMREGLEIACDTRLPDLHIHRYLKPFVEDELSTRALRKFVATPHAQASPWTHDADSSGPAVVAIGPEGGFIPYEVELFQANGFEPLSFGRRVLSVENAIAQTAALVVARA